MSRTLATLLAVLIAVLLVLGWTSPAAAQTRLLDYHRTTIPPILRDTDTVTAGDIDGDGFPDLLTDGEILFNDGHGVFRVGPILNEEIPMNSSLIFDADGDGWNDIFLSETDAIRHFKNLGGGEEFVELSALLPSLAPTARTRVILSEDVDDDGDLDLYLVRRASHRLWENVGGFFTQTSGQVPPGNVFGVWDGELADFDSDGDKDLWCANNFDEDWFLTNNGTGTFTHMSSSLPPGTIRHRSLAVGDVDGDGDLDVFAGSDHGVIADELYVNDGTGTFALGPPSADDAADTMIAELLDPDDDGQLELILAGFAGKHYYENDGAGFFSEIPDVLPNGDAGSYDVAVFDADADGDEDLFYGTHHRFDELHLSDNQGGFIDVSKQNAFDGQISMGAALADYDGDGRIDAVIANPNAQSTLLFNEGLGAFRLDNSGLPIDTDRTTDIATADLDGDGDHDLYLTADEINAPSFDSLWVNQGDGTFVDASSRIPTDSEDSLDVILTDLDGDDDIDAVLNQRFWIKILFNDGTGTFVEGPTLTPACQFVGDLAAVDMDGDGDADIIGGGWARTPPPIVETIPDTHTFFLNDGAGNFTEVSPTHWPTIRIVTQIITGDLDGDGDIDVLETVNPFEAVRTYWNDGTGILTPGAPLPSGAEFIALFDLDFDGDLDVFYLPRQEVTTRVGLNDGTGSFTFVDDRTVPLPADFFRTMAIADLDGDGKDDIFMNGSQSTQAIFTQDRKLTYLGPPRIGKPIDFKMTGRPHHPWLIGYQVPTIRTSPFRPDYILFVQEWGVLDADGVGFHRSHIPDDVSLIGTELVWQAMIGLPFLPSNEVVTRASGF